MLYVYCHLYRYEVHQKYYSVFLSGSKLLEKQEKIDIKTTYKCTHVQRLHILWILYNLHTDCQIVHLHFVGVDAELSETGIFKKKANKSKTIAQVRQFVFL